MCFCEFRRFSLLIFGGDVVDMCCFECGYADNVSLGVSPRFGWITRVCNPNRHNLVKSFFVVNSGQLPQWQVLSFFKFGKPTKKYYSLFILFEHRCVDVFFSCKLMEKKWKLRSRKLWVELSTLRYSNWKFNIMCNFYIRINISIKYYGNNVYYHLFISIEFP